jgi:carbamate kinase
MSGEDGRTALIAVGGNALILSGQHGTIGEQFENARATARHIAKLIAGGWRVVLTHGNGPQVGFILLRSELVSADRDFTPSLSLDRAVADSEGGIGYILGNSLANELGRLGLADRVACLLTQTVVDPADPAFAHPTKPIGRAYTKEEADEHRAAGWSMVEEIGRGYRRVVPSPRPLRIVETEAVRALVGAGFVVLAGGGGGIPVVEEAPGCYRGVEAVVDKDFASALLAASLGVDYLVICTGVERVAVRFGQPDQAWLDRVTVAEARAYLEAGEFPEGSMGPKIRAAIDFLERGGKEVVVTSEAYLEPALNGEAGTHITR